MKLEWMAFDNLMQQQGFLIEIGITSFHYDYVNVNIWQYLVSYFSMKSDLESFSYLRVNILSLFPFVRVILCHYFQFFLAANTSAILLPLGAILELFSSGRARGVGGGGGGGGGGPSSLYSDISAWPY